MLVASIQLAVTDNESKQDRINRVEKMLAFIEKDPRQPDLILLPEIWGTGFFRFEDYELESEEVESGETVLRLAPWASKLGCHFLIGSIVERQGDKLFNASLLVNQAGEVVGKYRKIHLFGYDSHESALLTPGDTVEVYLSEFGNWGFTTCYDLRFPELYRKMVDKGATIFLVVSAWPMARLEHWRLFNQTRALENQAFLVSCNCAGTQKGRQYAGHSMTVNPWGEVIQETGAEESICWSEINLAEVQKFRAEFPALKDRRIF